MQLSEIRFSLRGASGDFSTCRYQAMASMTLLRSFATAALLETVTRALGVVYGVPLYRWRS